jgi:membrane-associated phospholipid phosphatase
VVGLAVQLGAALHRPVREHDQAVGVSSWIVVYALKLVWGRVRFRDLQTAGADFSAWYLPQGLTGHLSFPSGHAAMSWVLLPCLLLWRPRSLAFWLAAALLVGWALFVAASRVVIGAHYFTDVLFSTAFTLGCTCRFVFQTKADSAQPIQVDSLRG